MTDFWKSGVSLGVKFVDGYSKLSAEVAQLHKTTTSLDLLLEVGEHGAGFRPVLETRYSLNQLNIGA